MPKLFFPPLSLLTYNENLKAHPLTFTSTNVAWKLRFEGYGPSTYTSPLTPSPRYPKLLPDPIPDYFPPYYQPSGPSHYGGAFAEMGGGAATSDTAKEAAKAGVITAEEPEKAAGKVDGCGKNHGDYPACWTDVKTKGCGAPAPVLHQASQEIVKDGY